ncbi:MAG: Gfo/Idh/MocA family oxidoreductase [Cyclobacteriaceae bacterium]
MSKRKIRMGMIGGSQEAFIGAVHRCAAALDGHIDLVCGAFSSNPEKSKSTGESLYLDPDRVYGSWQDMIEKEAALPDDVRMDCVSIVTPNHVHYGPAMMAMDHGFHVVLDKPLSFSSDEAKEMAAKVDETGVIFALTHTYTGYPMVKEAKHLVSSGKLGKVRKVYVEYPQGWLATNLEQTGLKQAEWRTDPSRSGKGGCIGDIGTHAANMAEYVSGLKISSIFAETKIFVDGRKLDDDAGMLLRFDNGATGVLFSSQVAAGAENNIKVRVFGEKGGVEWEQNHNNTLTIKWLDKPIETYRTGGDKPYLSEHAMANLRLPGGHPEGYLEAFANIYKNFALTIQAKLEGLEIDNSVYDFPTVYDGVRGMDFVDKVVESSDAGGKWVDLD